AELLLPDGLALDGVTEQPGGAEEGVDVLAVGGAGGGGVAVPGVGLFEGDALGRGLLPEELAVGGAVAEDEALAPVGRGAGVEVAVAPGDGGALAGAGHLHLPGEVFLVGPGQRDAHVGTVALLGGAAPVGPVGVGRAGAVLGRHGEGEGAA